MAEKIIKTRIINKHAVKADWDKATNFIPKKGEIIIYDDLKKIKIGDGETTVVNLDFMDGGIEVDTDDFISKTETNKQSISSPLSIINDNNTYFELYSNTGNIVQISDSAININYGSDILNYPTEGGGEQTIATREWVNENVSVDTDDFISKKDTNTQTIASDLLLSGDSASARKLTVQGVQGTSIALNSESDNVIEVSSLRGANTTRYNFPVISTSDGSILTKTVATTDDIPSTSNFISTVETNTQNLSSPLQFYSSSDGSSLTVTASDFTKIDMMGQAHTLTLPEEDGTLATQEWVLAQIQSQITDTIVNGEW